MKRSEINNILKEGVQFFDKMNFKLPPFAYWSLEEWKNKGSEYDEIRDNMLGWDITDFGSGNFKKNGLLLFTLRNGNLEKEKYRKTYAEKIMLVEEKQLTPYHFHSNKMEDIINRGGGNLMVQLYKADSKKEFSDQDVQIAVDGKNYQAPAGITVKLKPGESITLFPEVYHQFWGEENRGKVLVGEVSKVNDDNKDNYFLEADGRFPEIEEDEPPLYLLVNDY